MANITPRQGEQGMSTRPSGFLSDPIEAMRELLRWDPFGEMGRVAGGGLAFHPQFEVKETRDAYVFKADLPGVKEDDLDISLTGNRLTISGKREAEKEDESDRFYAYERSYGSFSRSFTLPEGCDTENVNADLNNGVLSVMLPKKAEVQPKRISVNRGGSQMSGRSDQKAKH